MHRLLAVVIFMVAAAPASAVQLKAQGEDGKIRGWFAQFEGSMALISAAEDKSLLAGRFGYGLNGGYRWSSVGLFLHMEHNMWLSTAGDGTADVVSGAVNIGVGGEYIFAKGFVRTSLAVGPSILVFDAALDEKGEVGFFLDARTIGLRWAIHEHMVLGLDPLTFAIVMPVTSGIPILEVQYRTSMYLEGAF